eukprot:GHVU01050078.1.p1 GENE.GHVU01050078.1~~GHVU01050078.1.p1  ORF type:complete len:102 (+),score=9.08 GHVU01050078.1:279-584(+)
METRLGKAIRAVLRDHSDGLFATEIRAFLSEWKSPDGTPMFRDLRTRDINQVLYSFLEPAGVVTCERRNPSGVLQQAAKPKWKLCNEAFFDMCKNYGADRK